MSCLFPKLAFQNTSVKQPLRFTGLPFHSDSWKNKPKHPDPNWKSLKMPCGGCLYCRLKHSRENAIRCVHEASMHKDSIFVTLTYNPESLPANNTFNFNHPVLFMKRLRRLYGPKIKSFVCAEYGEKGGRPHYHLLIFGLKPTDMYLWRMSKNPRMKCQLFRSPSLERLWGTGKGKNFRSYGNMEIGDVTMQSAAYVARYVVKKNKTKKAIEKELNKFHEKSICVSRREGIGLSWLKKYYSDIYTTDSVHYKNRQGAVLKMTPPKYYDKKFEQMYPDEFLKIKLARQAKMSETKSDTKQQSQASNYILEVKTKQLVRSYEENG